MSQRQEQDKNQQNFESGLGANCYVKNCAENYRVTFVQPKALECSTPKHQPTDAEIPKKELTSSSPMSQSQRSYCSGVQTPSGLPAGRPFGTEIAHQIGLSGNPFRSPHQLDQCSKF